MFRFRWTHILSVPVLAGSSMLFGCLADPSDLGDDVGGEDSTGEATSALGGKGMTWGKLSHDATRGQDQVNCSGCNAYQGDTACTEYRPILCINKDGASSNGFVPGFYDGWAAGNIALTSPVLGASLTSLSVANALCLNQFGPGWRMAEFHDGGGGWGWRAYGNINGASRFWVYINDQPANCWN